MGRAPCCDKANVKRGPWSPEEDAKLKTYIEKHGTGGNWIALPPKIGLKRCGKSCRLRWLNYLRPNIKHGGFTEDEDNLICSLYITIGSRWSIIAGQLPGRTDNDIKNYWNTRLKKKLLGRQRRQLTKRQSITTDRRNYSNNHDYSLNPPPIPETQAIANNTSIMMMPALEPHFPSNSQQTTANIALNATTEFQYNCDALSHHHYHCSDSVMDAGLSYGLDAFFDISCLFHPPPAISHLHETIWQRKPQQHSAFSNQPTLLG